jgi:ABC-2 type transport system permease protein
VALSPSGTVASLHEGVATVKIGNLGYNAGMDPDRPTLKQYLDLYWRLISARIRSQMQYRLSFLVDLLSTFLGTFVEFGAIAIFYLNFPAIGGWSLGEVALLYGMSAISFASAELLVSGFDNFPMVIRAGEFDKVLVRPLGAFFQVLASEAALRRLGRFSQGVVALLLAVLLTGAWQGWSAVHWIGLPLFVLGGTLLFSGLFVIGATYSFWTVESLEIMNILTYGGTEMTSYPMHIYQDWIRHFFTFIVPIAFVNYYPALWLLGKPDPMGLPAWTAWLAPAACAAVFAASVAFWGFGVRHYTSTGS